MSTTFDFHTNRAFLNAHGEEQRQLAAEARHGGRALTDKIVQRQGVLLTLVGADQDLVNERWQYSIDPAGGGWDWIAKNLAANTGYDRPDYLKTTLSLPEAEAMLSWPIYRIAISGVVTEAEGRLVDKLLRIARDDETDAEMIEHDFDLALDMKENQS